MKETCTFYRYSQNQKGTESEIFLLQLSSQLSEQLLANEKCEYVEISFGKGDNTITILPCPERTKTSRKISFNYNNKKIIRVSVGALLDDSLKGRIAGNVYDAELMVGDDERPRVEVRLSNKVCSVSRRRSEKNDQSDEPKAESLREDPSSENFWKETEKEASI